MAATLAQSYSANAPEFAPRYLTPDRRAIDEKAVEAAAFDKAVASKAFEKAQIASGKWAKNRARTFFSHYTGALNFETRNAEIELSRAEDERNPGRPMSAIEEEFLCSGKWTRD